MELLRFNKVCCGLSIQITASEITTDGMALFNRLVDILNQNETKFVNLSQVVNLHPSKAMQVEVEERELDEVSVSTTNTSSTSTTKKSKHKPKATILCTQEHLDHIEKIRRESHFLHKVSKFNTFLRENYPDVAQNKFGYSLQGINVKEVGDMLSEKQVDKIALLLEISEKFRESEYWEEGAKKFAERRVKNLQLYGKMDGKSKYLEKKDNERLEKLRPTIEENKLEELEQKKKFKEPTQDEIIMRQLKEDEERLNRKLEQRRIEEEKEQQRKKTEEEDRRKKEEFLKQQNTPVVEYDYSKICKYVFKRGEHKGKQCDKHAVVGSDYCDMCVGKMSNKPLFIVKEMNGDQQSVPVEKKKCKIYYKPEPEPTRDYYTEIRNVMEENFRPIHQGKNRTQYLKVDDFVDILMVILDITKDEERKEILDVVYRLDSDLIEDDKIYTLEAIGKFQNWNTYLDDEQDESCNFKWRNEEEDEEDEEL